MNALCKSRAESKYDHIARVRRLFQGRGHFVNAHGPLAHFFATATPLPRPLLKNGGSSLLYMYFGLSSSQIPPFHLRYAVGWL